MTIAYSPDFQDVFWMERMDWANADDTPVDISVYGNVVAVTGNSAEPGEDTEIHTVLYDAVDGSTLWTNRLGPVGLNGAAGVYVRGGSVYVVGTTHDGEDFVATSVVYSVSTGNPLSDWPRSFTPSGLESAATCMHVTVDGGALIVGGHCWGPSDSINTHGLVINYEGDPNPPNPKWYGVFDRGGVDRVTAVSDVPWKPTSTSSVSRITHATGYSNGENGNELMVLQYMGTSQSTLERWERFHTGGYDDDRGVALAVTSGSIMGGSPAPSIIAAGWTRNSSNNLDMLAVHYQTTFALPSGPFGLSTQTWNGPAVYADSAGGDDYPVRMVREGELFFLTGRSWGGTGSSHDMMSWHWDAP